MKHASNLLLVPTIALFAMSSTLTAQNAQEKPSDAVALVTSLSGNASLLIANKNGAAHKPRTLNVKPLDVIPAHATLQLAEGAEITMTFINAKNYKLSGPAKISITAFGPIAPVGVVRELSSSGAVADLPGIEDKLNKLQTPGVVRVRSGVGITDLYPAKLKLDEDVIQATALPDKTVLRFTPDPKAESYRVAVEDESGVEIFQSQVSGHDHEIAIRRGVLHAGRHYHWTVKAFTSQGEGPSGDADFVTLTSVQIAKRAAWEKAWKASKNPNLRAAVIAIDFRLGLFAEAREELRAVPAVGVQQISQQLPQ